jgi:hypothetical protein
VLLSSTLLDKLHTSEYRPEDLKDSLLTIRVIKPCLKNLSPKCTNSSWKTLLFLKSLAWRRNGLTWWKTQLGQIKTSTWTTLSGGYLTIYLLVELTALWRSKFSDRTSSAVREFYKRFWMRRKMKITSAMFNSKIERLRELKWPLSIIML